MTQHNSLVSELRAVQRKHGKFAALELLIPDLSGILRGKRIRPNDFEKYCKDGFVFCAGTNLFTNLGETVAGIPFVESDGDPDLPAHMVAGDIGPGPWG